MTIVTTVHQYRRHIRRMQPSQDVSRDQPSAADRVIAAIDALAKTGPIDLEVASDPRALIREVSERGAFSRALLMISADGKRPRIAISPRVEAGPLTVTELLEDDHRRLDAIAEEVLNALQTERPSEPDAIETFVFGLSRHIRIEEDVLFALFEARTGVRNSGPTAVMRHEHRLIEQPLGVLGRHAATPTEAMDRTTRQEVLNAFSQLSALLQEHNVKEERVLYPMIDRLVAGGELLPLLLKIATY